jgi:hypothetical protein
MNAVIDRISEIRAAARNASGWGKELEALLGDVVRDAGQVSTRHSVIAEALEQLGDRVLPPETEQVIARLIGAAANDWDRAAQSASTYRALAGDQKAAGLPDPTQRPPATISPSDPLASSAATAGPAEPAGFSDQPL